MASRPAELFQKRAVWVTIPVLVMRPPYTKVAISLPDLIRQTNAFSVKRRAGCDPVLKSSRPKELYLEYKVTCHENYSDPKGHDVQVKFDLSQVEETQDAKRLDVKCSCSCPAFLYWGAQWNLHQRDGLHGEPRPLLQAPTERLDLRGNFVICKHLKAVFERILPAVQHNIVKIVREREVKLNKERQEQQPPSEKEKGLRERQEEMRKKKEIDKIVKVKDEDTQKKMIDDLVEEESQRLEKGKPALPTSAPPPAPPPIAPPAPAPPPKAAPVIKRTEPAAKPKAPAPRKMSPAQPDMRDLIRQEEKKLQKGKKPLPKLPARVKPVDKLKRKRTSLEASLLGIVAATRNDAEKIWDGERWVQPTDKEKFVVEQGDGMILTDQMTYQECKEWVRQHPEAGIVNGRFLNLAIVKATPEKSSWEPDFSYFDQELMKGMHIK